LTDNRDIIVVDGNAIWHRRLIEALGQNQNIISFQPKTNLRFTQLAPIQLPVNSPQFIDVHLPPGWASLSSAISQRLLARSIRSTANMLDNPILLMTSIAYEPLSRFLSGRLPLVYYCSDDFREYEGWSNAKHKERRLTKRCDLSIFVSEALRRRALDEYRLDHTQTFVSPNATEPRFISLGEDSKLIALADLARPVLGILGGLSERLDLAFVKSLVDLPETGSLRTYRPFRYA